LARSTAALCAVFISMKQRPIALPMHATSTYANAHVYWPVAAIDAVRISGPSHDEPRFVSSYSAKKAACQGRKNAVTVSTHTVDTSRVLWVYARGWPRQGKDCQDCPHVRCAIHEQR
jgi:hypothetical protein